MEFYTAAGVYINCKLYPFIVWILSGWKLFETRTWRVNGINKYGTNAGLHYRL